MAQDDNSISDNTQISDILRELQQIRQKSAKDEELLEQLRGKEQQRREKEKKQEQQKENGKVLKKLPTVLTTNERKRYQEIGKRFMLGAQQQFQQMKKGIKLKQMMKTSKDFFLKGFDKIKEEKANVKKKSFWGVLLGSIIVIGAAALLFKDKIVKMMPNLSQNTGGLFKSIIRYLGNMVRSCWQFISTTIGGSISGIFQRIFSESIPNILQLFFFDTLPNAIFNTYLAIMAQFDPRANAMLASGAHDSNLENEINMATAQGGQLDQYSPKQAVDQLAGLGNVMPLIQRLNKGQALKQQEMNLISSFLGRLLMYGQTTSKISGVTMESIKSQRTALLGYIAEMMRVDQSELQQMISTGRFNLEFFMNQFLASDRSGKAMAQILHRMGVQDDSSVERYQNNLRSHIGSQMFQSLARAYQGTRVGLQTGRAAIASDDNRQVLPSTAPRVQDRLGYMYDGMGYVSLRLLQDATVSQVNKFLQAANNFVGQGDLASVFRNQVGSFVESLGSYFRDFFVGSLGILKSVLRGILSYTDLRKRNDNSTYVRSTTAEDIPQNNGIIVNVDMTGNEALSLGLLIRQLFTNESQMVTHITRSIQYLEEMNKILESLGEMHGISTEALNTLIAQMGAIDGSHRLAEGTLLGQVLQNKAAIEQIRNPNYTPPHPRPARQRQAQD